MSNIVLAFENAPVTFTPEAYLNATEIAKHFNKSPKDYLRLESTKQYIAELTERLNSLSIQNQLVIVKKGGLAEEQGTWLHPKLTIDFARWLSAKFAIWCDEQIENILHGKHQPEPPKLTYATKEQRKPLVNAVRRLVKVASEKGKSLNYENAHSIINLKMGVDSIEELTPEQIPQAMTLVGEILEKVVLEGEYIAKGKAEPQPVEVYDKITPKQKQELTEAIHQSFCGWVFNDSYNQHGYNYLRAVFKLQNIDDLPADNLPLALSLIADLKEKNWQFLLAVSEIKEQYLKEYVEAGAPWTPTLKRKWRKLIGTKLPERPDWQKVKDEIETKLLA